MEKIKIAITGIVTLVVLYIVSSALEDTVVLAIDNAIIGESSTDALLQLMKFVFNLLATGILELIIGFILVVTTLIKNIDWKG